jgi:hypothetical protein
LWGRPGWLRTKMPGAPEPEYFLARKVLLDELEALGDQRSVSAGDSSR